MSGSWMDAMTVEILDHFKQVGFAFPMRVTIISADAWLLGRFDRAPAPELIRLTVLAHHEGEAALAPPARIAVTDAVGHVFSFQIAAEGARLH